MAHQTNVKVVTPSLFNAYTNGQHHHDVVASTVGEALQQLIVDHPNLKSHLLDEGGQLLSYVQLFLNEDNIRDRDPLNTPLQEQDELLLLLAVAGG